MQYLRADTEVIVTIGPFVDVGDGFTPQTDITLGGDEAEILKHGSDTVVDISGSTWAAVASCRGYYSLTITASNTDTEGQLTVIVQDDSDCLPVRADYMVVNANVFDSLFAAATTDYLQVDTVSIAANVVTATAINADAITAAKIADNAISSEHLNTGALTADAFAADAIVAATLATGAISADAFAADAIVAATLATGAISADAFAADAIVAATLATGAITADAFAANAIVAATLNADCITSAKIADDAIAAEHIAAGAIANATFAADVGSTAYATNIIALAADKAILNYDGPTNAEFELRSLPSADYVVVGDTLAGVTTVTTTTNLTNAPTVGDFTAAMKASITTACDTSCDTVTVTSMGANVVTAAAIAAGAIDNATFAADVGSTAFATNIIALAVDKSIGDKFTFTVAGQADANLTYINDVAVTGTGVSGDEWGP